jgi:hypothetical protein
MMTTGARLAGLLLRRRFSVKGQISVELGWIEIGLMVLVLALCVIAIIVYTSITSGGWDWILKKFFGAKS